MNDIAEEGIYVWEDGSPVSHIRFKPGEPNNYNDEDCMGLWSGNGGFADVKCDGWGGFFLCETDYNRIYS